MLRSLVTVSPFASPALAPSGPQLAMGKRWLHAGQAALALHVAFMTMQAQLRDSKELKKAP